MSLDREKILYTDPNFVKEVESNIEKFRQELKILCKKYGVALVSVGCLETKELSEGIAAPAFIDTQIQDAGNMQMQGLFGAYIKEFDLTMLEISKKMIEKFGNKENKDDQSLGNNYGK